LPCFRGSSSGKTIIGFFPARRRLRFRAMIEITRSCWWITFYSSRSKSSAASLPQWAARVQPTVRNPRRVPAVTEPENRLLLDFNSQERERKNENENLDENSQPACDGRTYPARRVRQERRNGGAAHGPGFRRP